ncbi:N-chimaerin [Papilio xuthus]|uniref:N-chimaerin n=1 Tax=Papilio xuthus TaxID=66420 RepID=A0A194Q1F1_PAPXU|nr:N-chimaerin [Papilio xuthus]
MENLKNIWKPELYRIQLEAPTPKRLICENCPDRPEFYGKEYHGIMGHKEASLLLENESNGAFLIRKGNQHNDFFTLTWRASNRSSPIINRLETTQSDVTVKKMNYDLTPTIEDIPLLYKYSKAHTFKVHTFKGLNWCELCANFLWGFTAQGVKCEDCGFIAHSKCSERVPNHCLPDLKKLRGVFGIDLTTLLNAHSSTLPFVVKKCVNEIEARGMDSEGIYRVSGFADEIEALKMAFDKDGEATDLSVYSNINVIAGTLKLYLRLLPVPLITYEVHPKLVSAIQMKTTSVQVTMLRECLDLLPPAHFNCLQYMVQHLHRVSQLAEVNKMSAHNLSTVFAPTLVATPQAISDLASEIRALQTLIEYCPQIYYGNK